MSQVCIDAICSVVLFSLTCEFWDQYVIYGGIEQQHQALLIYEMSEPSASLRMRCGDVVQICIHPRPVLRP